MTEAMRYEELSFVCYRGHFINTHPKIMPPYPIVVDAGASGGEDMNVWLDWFPVQTERLICLEPNKTNMAKLWSEMKRREADVLRCGVQIENVAIGGQRAPGTMMFTEFYNPRGKYVGWGSLKSVNDGRARGRKDIKEIRRYKVSVIRVNNLFKRMKIPRIDILKMDIEGSEDEVIRTMWPETAARIGQLTFENHYPGKTEKYMKKLRLLGFDNIIQCRSEIHAYRRRWAQQVARSNKG